MKVDGWYSIEYQCNNCGTKYYGWETAPGNGASTKSCWYCVTYTYGTAESLPSGATLVSSYYDLGCGKTTSTIESVEIVYDK